MQFNVGDGFDHGPVVIDRSEFEVAVRRRPPCTSGPIRGMVATIRKNGVVWFSEAAMRVLDPHGWGYVKVSVGRDPFRMLVESVPPDQAGEDGVYHLQTEKSNPGNARAIQATWRTWGEVPFSKARRFHALETGRAGEILIDTTRPFRFTS